MSVQKSLKEITLLVFDEKANFQSETTQQRIGKDLFRKVIPISSQQEFKAVFNALDENEKFVLICHVFHAGDGEKVPLRGYIHFSGTGIEEEYGIEAALVSAGDSGNVMRALSQSERVERPVFIYTVMRDNIKNGKIKVYTKIDLLNSTSDTLSVKPTTSLKIPEQYDFGVITALYKDEFEQLKGYFEWTPDKNYSTSTMLYRAGHLKGHPGKKIIVGIPPATGMVDSAIVATEMLTLFKPRYLLMSGVCGGKPSLQFGDIVVASKVFTFQKGKISDIKDMEGKPIKLYTRDRQEVDYEHLYDHADNPMQVSLEDFEIEHDSMLEIHSLTKTQLEDAIDDIQDSINKEISPFNKEITIHFDSMACSTMVINNQGYFEDKIKKVDRKVVAVEMESYGVARSTKIANNGETKWVIFKSVMDNMKDKDDKAKKLAARTSALFLRELLDRNVLK